MAKLDWSRVALRVFDPARYQRGDDFVTPDNRKATPKKLSPAAQKREAESQKRTADREAARRARKAVARAAKHERERLAKAAKAVKTAKAEWDKTEARQRKEEKARLNKAAVEARRIAFSEYQKTPEYAAKIEHERAEMAVKKKSHLEAWAEKQAGLKEDRASLRQRWKERLLGSGSPKDRG